MDRACTRIRYSDCPAAAEFKISPRRRSRRSDRRQNPKTQIEVSTPEGAAVISTIADADGKANLELPMGNFLLLVKSQGFCPQKRSLVISGQPQTIRAELKVDSCPGPCQAACVTVVSTSGITNTQAGGRTRGVAHPALKIVVEDNAGVRISLARIGVRTEQRELIEEIISSKFGEAALALEPGKYDVSASAPGFDTSSQVVDLTGHNEQSIKFTLAVGNQCAGCLSIGPDEEIGFEHFIPEEAIPMVSLESLPLPVLKLRISHRWAH